MKIGYARRGEMGWIEEELKTVDLGDKRHDRRLGKILKDLTAQPEASVP